MKDFIPMTYRMDVRVEREAFFAQQEGKMPEHNSPTVHEQLGLCLAHCAYKRELEQAVACAW